MMGDVRPVIRPYRAGDRFHEIPVAAAGPVTYLGRTTHPTPLIAPGPGEKHG